MHRLLRALQLFFSLSFSQSIYADTIFLQNGDRITGNIISMQENQLKFSTPYSDLSIPWADIKRISSDHTITVQLNNSSQLKGLLTFSDQGPRIQSSPLATAIPIKLANIKALNPPIISNDVVISGEIHAGGTKASGNTKNQTINAEAKIIIKSGKKKLSAGALYYQSDDDGIESENNFHIFAQYDYYFLPKWYAHLLTNFTKNRFQDLNSRTAFGAGLGHELWNTKQSLLSAEAGIAYTVEDFEDGTDREFIAGLWGLDYHYWILENRLQFFHDQSGIISFEDFSDVLVQTRTGIKVPIFQGFELRIQFDLDYDTKPAEGKKTTDTRYIIGAGYRW